MTHATGATDILITVGFVAALAAATLFLLYARRGKAMRARIDDKQREQDDVVRTTPGKVRKWMPGPLP